MHWFTPFNTLKRDTIDLYIWQNSCWFLPVLVGWLISVFYTLNVHYVFDHPFVQQNSHLGNTSESNVLLGWLCMERHERAKNWLIRNASWLNYFVTEINCRWYVTKTKLEGKLPNRLVANRILFKDSFMFWWDTCIGTLLCRPDYFGINKPTSKLEGVCILGSSLTY